MFSDKISDLFKAQLGDWELAGTNYRLLEKVKTRHLTFPGFEVLLQFNPERIVSSAAKVDAKSIGARPCFLCEKNRPFQQRGVRFESDFTVLVNPFPIFSRHLTIPSDEHTDQRIRYNFGKMLSLAEALPDYVIFYNGPRCGASAPDHFHFQAGNRGFMPVEKDFSSGRFAVHEFTRKGAEVWYWRDYLRGIISLKGQEREHLETLFHKFFERFSALQPDEPEPMMNILVYKTEKIWIVHLIPRLMHRPVRFFMEGKDQLLISPASVDLGGVVITPREEDFRKIKSGDISDIFRQVCYTDEEIYHLISDLK
jgi:hypothetical protein